MGEALFHPDKNFRTRVDYKSGNIPTITGHCKYGKVFSQNISIPKEIIQSIMERVSEKIASGKINPHNINDIERGVRHEADCFVKGINRNWGELFDYFFNGKDSGKAMSKALIGEAFGEKNIDKILLKAKKNPRLLVTIYQYFLTISNSIEAKTTVGLNSYTPTEWLTALHNEYVTHIGIEDAIYSDNLCKKIARYTQKKFSPAAYMKKIKSRIRSVRHKRNIFTDIQDRFFKPAQSVDPSSLKGEKYWEWRQSKMGRYQWNHSSKEMPSARYKTTSAADKALVREAEKTTLKQGAEAGVTAEAIESQAVKQVEKKALTSAEKTAGKTAGKIVGKKLLGLLGVAANLWAIYDTLSGKDFPVHSGGMYKAKEELTSASYSEKEHNDALELYMRLNKPTTKTLAGFESYPAFFVYIKFAKDKRIQNMPPRKIKAMINLTIDCINKKYFTTSGFTVEETIKAFDNFEKMNRLFRK